MSDEKKLPYKQEVKPNMWEITVSTGEYSDHRTEIYVVYAVNEEMAWYSFLHYVEHIYNSIANSYSPSWRKNKETYRWKDRTVVFGDEDGYSSEDNLVYIMPLTVLYSTDVDIAHFKELEE